MLSPPSRVSMPKTKAQGKHRMTRRELAAALAPAAGAEAEIEAKFLLEASADEAWLRTAIARRLSGEPLQYILGEWEFMGLPFYVGPGTLIPRQDTETLCEADLAWLKTTRRVIFRARRPPGRRDLPSPPHRRRASSPMTMTRRELIDALRPAA